MKITNGGDWISIVFDCYAGEAVFVADNLRDIRNSVSVDYNFYLQGTGWGAVEGQYFTTQDILALSQGLASVHSAENASFVYSGEFPFRSSQGEPFYTFLANRRDDEVVLTLRIHDCLLDNIQITERMTLSRFQEIVDEFEDAAKRFPVIPTSETEGMGFL